jgi:hypothetical protein
VFSNFLFPYIHHTYIHTAHTHTHTHRQRERERERDRERETNHHHAHTHTHTHTNKTTSTHTFTHKHKTHTHRATGFSVVRTFMVEQKDWLRVLSKRQPACLPPLARPPACLPARRFFPFLAVRPAPSVNTIRLFSLFPNHNSHTICWYTVLSSLTPVSPCVSLIRRAKQTPHGAAS